MERRKVNITAGSTGGVGFVGLLQVAFIILKLCNVIDWSWVWVLAPIWISVILAIILVVVAYFLIK